MLQMQQFLAMSPAKAAVGELPAPLGTSRPRRRSGVTTPGASGDNDSSRAFASQGKNKTALGLALTLLFINITR